MNRAAGKNRNMLVTTLGVEDGRTEWASLPSGAGHRDESAPEAQTIDRKGSMHGSTGREKRRATL